jgi:hypothetical protein
LDKVLVIEMACKLFLCKAKNKYSLFGLNSFFGISISRTGDAVFFVIPLF